jgi:hypothetical protein
MNQTTALTKKYTKRYLLLIIAVVFILLLAIPYALGYRIGPGVKLERVGTLELTGLPKGASVYVDQSLQKTTTKAGNLNTELVGGSHSVIVSVPGDYPWNTIVAITSHKTTTMNPIFVGETPIATLLSGTDRDAALAGIASTTLPTEAKPLLLANGCAAVYVADNQLLAEATTTSGCTTPPAYLCDNAGTCSPTIIFSPVSPLTFVAKYPYRQDALVVQIDNVLYAIALDPRTPQFFAPILTATQPIIGTLPDGTVVVHNGSSVFRITL